MLLLLEKVPRASSYAFSAGELNRSALHNSNLVHFKNDPSNSSYTQKGITFLSTPKGLIMGTYNISFKNLQNPSVF